MGVHTHLCRTLAVRQEIAFKAATIRHVRQKPGATFMARRLRDSKLDTRSARSRLPQRREPYWRAIADGLALGYRKGATGGSWIAKHYSAEHGRRYDALGAADDILDPDGKNIFSFSQAQDRARAWRERLAKQDRGEPVQVDDDEPYTVAKAMDAYLRHLESDGRAKHSLADTRYRHRAFIRPKLSDIDIAALTPERLRHWRDGLAKAAPRLRTRQGEAQKHRTISTEDAQRARRASANRTWTILRAALNHAFHDGKVASDLAWRKVKPFGRVDAARIRYLSVAEAKRLINACDADFRPLVQAALQTGARYGELCQLKVSDLNPDVGTIAIHQSKSGKARHIVLTDEGRALFKQLTMGRAGSEPMFYKQWGASHQLRPMAEAVERAKIKPAISFHGLRHTWASLAVMSEMPLMVVARNLGHTDTRMVEKHYGHLAPSYITDAIRKHAPRFGFKPERKIVAVG